MVEVGAEGRGPGARWGMGLLRGKKQMKGCRFYSRAIYPRASVLVGRFTFSTTATLPLVR